MRVGTKKLQCLENGAESQNTEDTAGYDQHSKNLSLVASLCTGLYGISSQSSMYDERSCVALSLIAELWVANRLWKRGRQSIQSRTYW